MKFKSEILISELENKTLENLNFAKSLKLLSDVDLNKRIRKDSWSILECLEHLNLYGNYYLKEILNKINQSSYPNSPVFESGVLGNYFANSMLPKEKLNKMKTFKSMDTIYSNIDRKVITVFIEQQNEMLCLLELSRNKNLTKIKINISISKFIKIRLGDTFRVVINHNLRHIQQIKNIQKA